MAAESTTVPHVADPALDLLERELSTIRSDMLDAERLLYHRWHDVPEAQRESARNLIHYVAMRRHDLRSLQSQLALYGLSSLGRAESHTLPSIEAVLSVVRCLRGEPLAGPAPHADLASGCGRALLEAHTQALLGPPPKGRDVRIMVTMPTDAATDYNLVKDLLAAGMDCMRINAAHDGPAEWERMLEHLDRARAELGLPCRVLVDIAGPKIRTGPMLPLAAVARWKPDRDRLGRVIHPARIWLTARERPRPAPGPAAATLPVAAVWLSGVRVGDKLKLVDARDASRELTVVGDTGHGLWAECTHTGYVVPGTRLRMTRGASHHEAEIGELAAEPGFVRLSVGDTLILTRDDCPGSAEVRNDVGEVLQPATIGITLPEALEHVRAGEPIWFDDGRIGGVIRNVDPSRVEVTITRADPRGSRLTADKGINLPESRISVSAVTHQDVEVLRFFNGRADIIGYSFVSSEEDVHLLQDHLKALHATPPGIILKIETKRGFENLPSLLLAVMNSPSSGVMIARGDLAVECGYERLAEVQEQILWMAEASHTPVIWATQVLETLTKDGMPSRAEITDAAMSERAECVMLNKGLYIVNAVRMLDDILTRMQAHQQKKSAMLRELALARRFLATA